MNSDISDHKRTFRAEFRERRRSMPSLERTHANEALTQHLITLTQHLITLTQHHDARSITCYLPNFLEPDTSSFIGWANQNNIDVLVPISRDDGLLDWTLAHETPKPLQSEHFPAPPGEILNPSTLNTVDLILLPACAVDHSGVRLGWGRGYYDRMLGSMQKKPPLYAILFDNEYVDELPNEKHDQRVDGVVCPSGIYKCTNAKANQNHKTAQ